MKQELGAEVNGTVCLGPVTTSMTGRLEGGAERERKLCENALGR